MNRNDDDRIKNNQNEKENQDIKNKKKVYDPEALMDAIDAFFDPDPNKNVDITIDVGDDPLLKSHSREAFEEWKKQFPDMFFKESDLKRAPENWRDDPNYSDEITIPEETKYDDSDVTLDVEDDEEFILPDNLIEIEMADELKNQENNTSEIVIGYGDKEFVLDDFLNSLKKDEDDDDDDDNEEVIDLDRLFFDVEDEEEEETGTVLLSRLLKEADEEPDSEEETTEEESNKEDTKDSSDNNALIDSNESSVESDIKSDNNNDVKDHIIEDFNNEFTQDKLEDSKDELLSNDITDDSNSESNVESDVKSDNENTSDDIIEVDSEEKSDNKDEKKSHETTDKTDESLTSDNIDDNSNQNNEESPSNNECTIGIVGPINLENDTKDKTGEETVKEEETIDNNDSKEESIIINGDIPDESKPSKPKSIADLIKETMAENTHYGYQDNTHIQDDQGIILDAKSPNSINPFTGELISADDTSGKVDKYENDVVLDRMFKIAAKRIEKMSDTYTGILVRDFEDDYHKPPKITDPELQELIGKYNKLRTKYRNIADFIEARRICNRLLERWSYDNRFFFGFKPRGFLKAYRRGEIDISGFSEPKYIGKDKKDYNWKKVQEYIDDESLDPTDFLVDQNECYEGIPQEHFDNWEVHAYKYLPAKLVDAMRGLCDYDVEPIPLKTYKLPKKKKDMDEFDKAILYNIEDMQRDMNERDQLLAFAYSMSESAFEQVAKIDKKLGNKVKGVKKPSFKGINLYKKNAMKKYNERFERYRDKTEWVNYNGKMMLRGEYKEREFEDALERNGFDVNKIRKNYNKTYNKKLKRANSTDEKLVKELKEQVGVVSKRIDDRIAEFKGKKPKKSKKHSKDSMINTKKRKDLIDIDTDVTKDKDKKGKKKNKKKDKEKLSKKEKKMKKKLGNVKLLQDDDFIPPEVGQYSSFEEYAREMEKGLSNYKYPPDK